VAIVIRIKIAAICKIARVTRRDLNVRDDIGIVSTCSTRSLSYQIKIIRVRTGSGSDLIKKPPKKKQNAISAAERSVDPVATDPGSDTIDCRFSLLGAQRQIRTQHLCELAWARKIFRFQKISGRFVLPALQSAINFNCVTSDPIEVSATPAGFDRNSVLRPDALAGSNHF
jgi:hypothetical protein